MQYIEWGKTFKRSTEGNVTARRGNYSYTIWMRRSDGKFYVEMFHGHNKERLPKNEFDTVEEAKTWAEEYEKSLVERPSN